MRLGLTSILSFHWAVVFAALAYGSIAHTGGAFGGLLGSLGIAAIPADATGWFVVLSVLLAGSFVFAAMLFGWSALIDLAPHLGADDADNLDLSRIAYCAAVSSLTVLLVICLARGGTVPYVALAAQLAALGASYLVVIAERLALALAKPPEVDEVKAAARLMALDAAHGAMLSRISGRDVPTPDGAR